MSSSHAEYHSAARERVLAKLSDDDTIAAVEVATRCGTTTLRVERDRLKSALTACKQIGFSAVSFVTAVDNLNDEGTSRGPRFTLVHQLQDVSNGHVVRFHTGLEESDPTAPTATDLWPGANFMEREVFDMFGIRFDGHPNLERLLMPDGYGHFPLRKEFPHQGIEPDRLYREWDERRRAKDVVVPLSEQTPSPSEES